MAVKETKAVEAETEVEVEATNTSDEVLGIHITNSAGEVLGQGYESVEAAQAHIDAHLTPDCTIVGG